MITNKLLFNFNNLFTINNFNIIFQFFNFINFIINVCNISYILIINYININYKICFIKIL